MKFSLWYVRSIRHCFQPARNAGHWVMADARSHCREAIDDGPSITLLLPSIVRDGHTNTGLYWSSTCLSGGGIRSMYVQYYGSWWLMSDACQLHVRSIWQASTHARLKFDHHPSRMTHHHSCYSTSLQTYNNNLSTTLATTVVKLLSLIR